MEFDTKYKGKVSSYNRVLNRIKNDLKMTDKNLKIIEEINKDFPELEVRI